MRWIVVFLVVACVFNASEVFAQSGIAKGSVDGMIDWKDPWSLTSSKFKEIAEALPRKKSERAYTAMSSGGTKVGYSIGKGFRNESGGGKMSLFEGRLPLAAISASFEADKATVIYFRIGDTGLNAKKAKSSDIALLKAELSKRTGDTAPKPYDQDVGGGRAPVPGLQWTLGNYKVRMNEVPMFSASGERSGTGVFNVRILRLSDN